MPFAVALIENVTTTKQRDNQKVRVLDRCTQTADQVFPLSCSDKCRRQEKIKQKLAPFMKIIIQCFGHSFYLVLYNSY